MIRALVIFLVLSLALPARAQDAKPLPLAEAPSDVPRAEKLELAMPAPYTGMLLNDAMLAKMDRHLTDVTDKLADVTKKGQIDAAERDLWKAEAAKTGIPVVTVVGIVVGVAVVGVAAGVIFGVYAGAQAGK